MITKSDVPGLTKSADALSQQIADRQAMSQKADQDSALQQLILGKQAENEAAKQKLQHQLDEQGATNRVEQAEALAGRNKGMGASVTKEGASLTKPVVDQTGKAMSDKNQMDEERHDTQALQSEHAKLVGKARDKLAALQEVQEVANDPTATPGILRMKLAKLEADQRMNQAEFGMVVPHTLKESAVGGARYFGIPVDEPALPQATRDQVNKHVASMQKNLNQNIADAGTELAKRAPTLAPSLHRSGKLQGTLQSLGMGMPGAMDASRRAAAPPAEAPDPLKQYLQGPSSSSAGSLTPAEQAELQALRAKHKPGM